MDTFAVKIWVLMFFCTFLVHGEYQIGIGIYDTTGAVAGDNFMGYAKLTQRGKGLHLRQYSRAFIITDEDNTTAVFVSSDVGMIGHAVKHRVVRMLQEKFGNKFTDQNVILSGTHTHGGPGGHQMEFLFDVSCLGFSWVSFNAICDGIYNSIVRANSNMQQGRILLNNGTLTGVNINRSPTSYLMNPEIERNKYVADTDTEMVQLKFVNLNDELMGMINWYPVHPTSMNNSNRVVTSDNVGYASLLLEKKYNNGALPGHGKIVTAFASTNLGDVSPNIKGAMCIDTGKPCDAETSTCNGAPTNCIAFGPGKDMYESTKIIAQKLSQKAIEISDDSANAVEVKGALKIGHIYVDMPKTKIMHTFENGTTKEVRGCSPAMGYSFAAGTTDGPGAPTFHQGMMEGIPMVEFIRDLLSKLTKEDIDCHHPKPILLPTGRMNVPYQWQPHIVPLQQVIIGSVSIAAVPGEPTTMSGRRLKDAIRETAEENGVDVQKVIVAGLCNTYTDYITTPEEYQKQRYEAASTIFGPNTLPIYIEKFREITDAILNDKVLSSSEEPEDISSKVISLKPPVIYDSPFNIGACVDQSGSKLTIGDTAFAVFNAGHPRNDVMHGKTFLTVEKKVEGSWEVIATDASWETKFIWKRVSATKSVATVEWDTSGAEPGDYRIRHFGNYRIFTKVYPYEGVSAEFSLISN